MDILAWLRKLGYGSNGLRFRNELMDFEIVDGLDSAHREEPTEVGSILLNGIAVPKVPVDRRLDGPAGPWGRSDEPPAGGMRQLVPVARVDRKPEQERSARFVGRNAELRVLLRAWRAAAGGRGRVVLLSGEAGIGKSRIVRELCERRAAHPHTVLWHRCSPEYAASPLHPLVSRLRQAAGLLREDGSDQRLAKLEALLTPVIEDPRSGAVLLADLLSLEAAEPYRQLKLMPQRLRARTFEILLAWLEGLARRQMVVAVYEDLQWADQSTLEFLDRMIDRIAGLPMLAVITFRPEFEAAWAGRACAVPLPIPSLAAPPCRAMIGHLCGDGALAEPVRAELIARSRGVPLLVEELTKAVLEIAEGSDDEMAEASAPVVPPGLPEAVIARLDRSSAVAALARTGAVIGREFTYELLAALAGWPEDQLRWVLDRLLASGLVVRAVASSDGCYAFKHALVWEAAYQSLSESARRRLHASLARLLEERWPDLAASAPELMARHYVAAGAPAPAVACLLRAGEQAADRCAHADAITLFSKGLELLDSFPAIAEQATYRARLLAALAQTLTATKGAGAPEVAQACSLARALCQGAEPHPALLPAIGTLWDHYSTRADFEAAGELAGHFQGLAADAADAYWSTEADVCRGVSALFMGQLPEARDRLTRSVVRLDGDGRRHLAPQVTDRGIVARAHLAQALWLCGYPDQAEHVSQEAITAARAAGHPFLLTYSLLAASWVCQLRRDAEASRALAADAIALAAEAGLPDFLAIGSIIHDASATDLRSAKPTVAAAAIDQALDSYRAAGAKIARPYLLSLRAGVHEAGAETERALGVLAEAAEVTRTTGERWYEPEIYRQQGELLLRQSVTNRRLASACFCQALALANQQGSKSFELRATLSLARMWSDLGRRAQAQELLAPVYGWFKEGFGTADLLAAKAFLDELSGGHRSVRARSTGEPPAPKARPRRPCRSGNGRARTGDPTAGSGIELRPD